MAVQNVEMSPFTETPASTLERSSDQLSMSKLLPITLLKKETYSSIHVGGLTLVCMHENIPPQPIIFVLVFAGVAGPIVDQKYNGVETLIGNAACSGLAVMILVISLGHISKAHFNPAVTIAFASLGHFPWSQVPIYIVAEITGAISASFVLKAAYHPFMSGGVTVPSVGVGQAFLLEFVATFILMFVITAVATDSTAVGDLAGVAIGGAVMLNILIIGPATGASMNPARTLGPAIAAGRYTRIWIYMMAPVLGAVTGAAVYALVKLPKDKDDP